MGDTHDLGSCCLTAVQVRSLSGVQQTGVMKLVAHARLKILWAVMSVSVRSRSPVLNLYLHNMKIMTNANRKKREQLGMDNGTASNRLRKMVLFSILKKHGENICFRCNEEIENIEELSIEHKERWLDSDNPIEKFFDLDNIAFSHFLCNVSAGRRKERSAHGTTNRYKFWGCRCDECKEANTKSARQVREKKNGSNASMVSA